MIEKEDGTTGVEYDMADGTNSKMNSRNNSSNQNKQAVVNRLSRAAGHLEMVKRMVEDDRNPQDVLIQLAAVKSALNNTGKVILKDYMRQCMEELMETGDREALEELNRAIDQFMK